MGQPNPWTTMDNSGVCYGYSVVCLSVCLCASACWIHRYSSIFGLVVITVERYIKIVHPVVYRNHYRRWMTQAGVVLPWIDGICTFLVPAWSTAAMVDGRCLKFQWPTRALYGGYMMTTFVWHYVVPPAFFLFAYSFSSAVLFLFFFFFVLLLFLVFLILLFLLLVLFWLFCSFLFFYFLLFFLFFFSSFSSCFSLFFLVFFSFPFSFLLFPFFLRRLLRQKKTVYLP